MKRLAKRRQAPDWFGCGRIITTASWNGFNAARTDYFAAVDAAVACGAPKRQPFIE